MSRYTHITVPTGMSPGVAGPRLRLVPHQSKEEAVSYAYRRGLRNEPTTFYQLTAPITEADEGVISPTEAAAELEALIPALSASSVLTSGLGRPFLVAKAEEELMVRLRKRAGVSTLDLGVVAHMATQLCQEAQ